MPILLSGETRVVVQGITGGAGKFHTGLMRQYGTQVVAGVTPGKGGSLAEGVPVFDTVLQAREATGANASIVFVPARFAADSVIEAADAGMDLVVCITEGIPALDMARVKNLLAGKKTVLVGPNTPGLIAPGLRCKLGIMPDMVFSPGRIGVISRSGTLTYEAVDQLTRLGLGQSTCIGIGGDPVVGMAFLELLERFEADSETDGVLLIGEIGGNQEERAARFIAEKMTKPVAAFIAGKTAPPGRRMGHAGAIISGGKGTAADKVAALSAAGIVVAPTPADIGVAMKKALEGRRQ
ncbi:MAG: succinate--CoA ligase subunit alpha [Deltaproteobacteria bacterium]|nr:succinate--CoA ligase subunit alpha [Deltaproteobacteria bacterium]